MILIKSVVFFKEKEKNQLKEVNQLNLTKQQTYVSDFLYNIYLESDSKELDEWLVYLARENGDEKLANMIGGNKQ